MMRLKALEPRWILVVAFFIAGSFFGAVGSYIWIGANLFLPFKIHPPASYRFINPLLAVDLFENRQFVQNKSLELQLQGIIDQAKKSQAITEAAVYYRDLEPGLWVGINEDARFSPGRLLKIPIMIAYYKIAETDPSILEQTIAYHGSDIVVSETSSATNSIRVGETYTVEELIQKMIVDSDDTAATLLFDGIDKKSLNEVFSDLGIDFKEDKETQDIISLKLYTLFFRVLYNATYLSRGYSERAMEYLVQADNSIGLGAGLPKDVAIANRFGIRRYQKRALAFYEMYDCGIIFYPNHPYLLCAVGNGGRLEDIKTFMKTVGQVVYTDTRYKYK